MIYQPDIVVVEQGESPAYALVVETRASTPSAERVSAALGQLKHYMSGMDCSLGLLVTPERLWVLQETFRSSGPQSVEVLGDYRTPEALRSRAGHPGVDFEGETQRWLEQLADERRPLVEDEGLRHVLESEILPALIGGEIRSGNPRQASLDAVG